MTSFRDSRKSAKDYFAWRKVRAEKAVRLVEKYQKISGTKILDIGCGYGSLAAVLASKKAVVTALDNDDHSLALAKKFLINKKVSLERGRAEKMPFPGNSFDIVFLFDVIEHVQKPKIVINEAIRVLKPKGLIYIEFTPYYSIIGHHLYDITFLPIHLLPKRIVKWLVYKKSPSLKMANEYWQTFESLNKLKISDLQLQLKGMELKKELFILKHPSLFEVNLPFLNQLGPAKDIFTFSYIGLFEKN